jgi:hypothetical protein
MRWAEVEGAADAAAPTGASARDQPAMFVTASARNGARLRERDGANSGVTVIGHTAAQPVRAGACQRGARFTIADMDM